MPRAILIVDDDPMQRQFLATVVEKKLGLPYCLAHSGTDALSRIQEQDFSLCLLDLSMPEMNGIETLRHIKNIRSELPIIIVTAYGDITNAVEAMKHGASDFIQKQEPPAKIEYAIRSCLEKETLKSELRDLKEQQSGVAHFSQIIGTSPNLKSVLREAKKAAETNIPVLLEGESGVGKELLARAIHGESPRSGKPFIAVNCGAIPKELVESTLFGHEKGAFTGAVAKALGKFREAEGGTLFLDEIGELPQDHQVKLLRALQEGEVEPVGLGKSVRVDVRIISATNRSLEGAVKEKAFRQDLLYRLNLLTLTLPPLRTRSKEDVHALAEHFLRTLSAEENSKVTSINEEALATLARYAWPGNIRELRNSIYRAILLCRSAILTPIDFLHLSHTNPYQEGAAVVPSAEAISLLNDSGEMRALAALEEEAIRFALEHYGWQMSKVARRLGIGRSTLYRRLDELSIISPESTQAAVHETSSHTG